MSYSEQQIIKCLNCNGNNHPISDFCEGCGFINIRTKDLTKKERKKIKKMKKKLLRKDYLKDLREIKSEL